MVSIFAKISNSKPERSQIFLEKIIDQFSRHVNAKLLDLETEVDEDLLCIKKNANQIVKLKERKKELEQIVRKVELFESIVNVLRGLQVRGRITWGFYKENVYDLIENFNSLNSSKLQMYLEKLKHY